MIISILQPEVFDDLPSNERQLTRLLDQAAALQADLVLLPELWNTPFIPEAILRHQNEWDFWLSFLQAKARALGFWIVAGTLPHKTEEGLFNSCAIINSSGNLVSVADKTHLLEVHTSSHTFLERDTFQPGRHLCRVNTPWGKIAVLICFDNRFPEAARSLCKDCFALLAPCGFNARVGARHWMPLFLTRAMENEVFVLAANPASRNYGRYTSYGHSMAVSPDGILLGQLDGAPGLLTVEIDPEEVRRIRHRSPFWNLRRPELYSQPEEKPDAP